MRRVADGRPRRVLLDVNRRPLASRRVGFADGGDHPTCGRIKEQLVRWDRRAATADDHVHCPLGRVDQVGGGCGRNRRQSGVGLPAAQRMRALIMVLVSAHHEIDAVFVEQRDPLLADAEVRAIELVGGRNGDLVHAYDDPIDVAITTGGAQLLFQPNLLRALGISAHVGSAAVLINDIVVGDADHSHRANSEGVPESARQIGLFGRRREREECLIGLITDRAIAALVLVVAGRRHPGTVARAAAVVLPEIPPCAHAVFGEIGVTEIAVEQMKQGPQPLHAECGIGRRR